MKWIRVSSIAKPRDKYDIAETDKVVVFSGESRTTQGVEDLVDAVHLIKKADIRLFVVGINNSEYCCRLVRQVNTVLGSRFVGLPFRPFQQAPECLMMADVIAIPQRHSPASVGQTPTKLFDAIAMAKPVVTTDVADIGEILGDCGWTWNLATHTNWLSLLKMFLCIRMKPRKKRTKLGRNAQRITARI